MNIIRYPTVPAKKTYKCDRLVKKQLLLNSLYMHLTLSVAFPLAHNCHIIAFPQYIGFSTVVCILSEHEIYSFIYIKS